MHKLANWIMGHRKAIIIIFVVFMVLSVIGLIFVEKESDLIVYLNKDSDTIVSKKILESEYSIIGDCNFLCDKIRRELDGEFNQRKSERRSISGKRSYLGGHV